MENNKTFSNNSDMRRPMPWNDRENQNPMHRSYPGMCPPPMMPYPGMTPPNPPAGGRPPMMPPMNPMINPRMPMNNRMPMNDGMSVGGGMPMNGGMSMGGGMPMNGGMSMGGGMPMNGGMSMGGGMPMNGGMSMNDGMWVNRVPMPYYYDLPLQEMAIWKSGDLSEEEWEQEWEKEVERLMEMYPATAKQIQSKVMEACESMDYEGSRMYDEYPDTVMMQQQCRKIRKDMNLGEDLEDLIEVLFHNEMFRRRCKRGRCRR